MFPSEFTSGSIQTKKIGPKCGSRKRFSKWSIENESFFRTIGSNDHISGSGVIITIGMVSHQITKNLISD